MLGLFFPLLERITNLFYLLLREKKPSPNFGTHNLYLCPPREDTDPPLEHPGRQIFRSNTVTSLPMFFPLFLGFFSVIVSLGGRPQNITP